MSSLSQKFHDRILDSSSIRMRKTPITAAAAAATTANVEIIQRLLVVHWKLAEFCTGQPLSEGSSHEEQAEEILYSYTAGPPENKQLNSSTAAAATTTTSYYSVVDEQVIAFVGICKALYTLPAALDDDESAQDVTNNVQTITLGQSIIVFEPLEGSSSGIVAIGQIARRSCGAAAATPSAVRAAIQRCHKLFCLLRGGGIERWLSITAAPDGGKMDSIIFVNDNSNHCCRYPGMGKLYQLRKRKRKLDQRAYGGDDPSVEKEKNEVEREIIKLQEKLPILSLRRMIFVHYEAFMGELCQRASIYGCVFRSIVEEIPAPIPQADGSHARHSAGSTRISTQARQLIEAMEKFLGAEDNTSENAAQAIGGSLFYQGNFVATKVSDREYSISNDTAVMLLQYMSSFRYQMYTPKSSQPSSGSSTPTRHKKGLPQLPQLIFSLGNRLNDSQHPSTSGSADCGFFPPPPLSLLSTLDEEHSFDGPYEGTHVWVLPFTIVERRGDIDTKYVDARAVMYTNGDYTILLYLGDHSTVEENVNRYVHVFRSFLDHMMPIFSFLPRASEISTDSDGSSEVLSFSRWLDSGCEIVFVDWECRSLFLYTDGEGGQLFDDSELNRTTRGFRTILRISSGSLEHSPSKTKMDLMDPILSYGFDCRHLLTSRLSLDTVLALEDAMSDIRRHSTCSSDEPIEACTSLSRRWVYSYAKCNQELYILLDSKKFVTMADVQRCTRDIRHELIHKIED